MATKKTYEPLPLVPSEVALRYQVVLQVLSGHLNVSEGARTLQVSRNHFQTLMHRGLSSLLSALTPKPAGRPSRSPLEAELTRENERLKRENRRLTEQAGMAQRLLGTTSELLKSRMTTTARGRARRTRRTTPAGEDSDDEGPRDRYRRAAAMKANGLPWGVAAEIAGVSLTTLKRWRAREASGSPLTKPVHRPPAPSPKAVEKARALVRDLHGLVGAESLSRSVPGLSRRQAGAIKHRALIDMERERLAACRRIHVAQPGVIRGFDQLVVPTREGRLYVLVSADAKVPYRTSVLVTGRYDGKSVAEALEKDFSRNGAPLVWRADRAKAHEAGEAQEVLRHHGVLVLHGPPGYPSYYGQLERQNEEHRAWLEACGALDYDDLVEQSDRMITALNTRWRRPSLGWKTAAEVWRQRETLDVDRAGLWQEVQNRVRKTARRTGDFAYGEPQITRTAIEESLSDMKLIRYEEGGWC